MGKPSRPVGRVRNDYTSTSVTTSAYVQLSASLAHDVAALDCFDSSGSTLSLAIGAAGSEAIVLTIPPGGTTGLVPILIPRGTRLAIKAVDTTASTGQNVLNFYA